MAKKDAGKAVESCLKTLQFSGVRVDLTNKRILKGSYGIGTWASIDCLTNYHGFTLVETL